MLMGSESSGVKKQWSNEVILRDLESHMREPVYNKAERVYIRKVAIFLIWTMKIEDQAVLQLYFSKVYLYLNGDKFSLRFTSI